MVIIKTKELKVEEIDLRKKEQAIQIMDEMRKKHKVRVGEKTSTEVIRHFRDTRYK